MEIEIVNDIDLMKINKVSRSKYLDIIKAVNDTFSNNPDKKALKITCNTRADAAVLRKGIKDWMGDDLNFNCLSKGNIVYFVRSDE